MRCKLIEFAIAACSCLQLVVYPACLTYRVYKRCRRLKESVSLLLLTNVFIISFVANFPSNLLIIHCSFRCFYFCCCCCCCCRYRCGSFIWADYHNNSTQRGGQALSLSLKERKYLCICEILETITSSCAG